MNAESTISKIKTEIESLAIFLKGCKLYQKEPWHSRGLRFLPVEKYIVFFIADDNKAEVNVLRVLYGRMDFAKLWS